MGDRPTPRYIIATGIAGAFGVVGAYLPWVTKRPVVIDGRRYYTSELVPSSEAGIQAIDPLILFVSITAVVAVAVARYVGRKPDVVLVGAGVLILVVAGDRFHKYWSVERYAVELGLSFVVIGGLIYTFAGIGTLLKRHSATRRANDGDSSVS